MSSLFPDKLNLDGEYDYIIANLYSVFEADIKESQIRFNNMPIVFDNRYVDSVYEEGFWHLVTRGKDQERLLDYKRAKRLPWLKPIIINHSTQEILKWNEVDTDKRGRLVNKTHIWYRNGKYLVILKEIPRKYFLTTAFYVNGRRNDDYYCRKYKKAQKKGLEF